MPKKLGLTRHRVDVAAEQLQTDLQAAWIDARFVVGAYVTAIQLPIRQFAESVARAGLPPERMIVLLKQCLAETELSSAGAVQLRAATDAAVTRAIDAFYHEREADRPPVRLPLDVGAHPPPPPRRAFSRS
jgi:hypothetical protein